MDKSCGPEENFYEPLNFINIRSRRNIGTSATECRNKPALKSPVGYNRDKSISQIFQNKYFLKDTSLHQYMTKRTVLSKSKSPSTFDTNIIHNGTFEAAHVIHNGNSDMYNKFLEMDI